MKLLIKKVGKNTFDPETDEISNFWVTGILQSGKEFRILDSLPYDLRKYENKEIECLLFMVLNPLPIEETLEEELTTLIFDGIYLGEYDLPDKWNIPKYIKWKYKDISNSHAIKIDNDIFIISPRNLKYYNVKKGENFTFEVIQFELWAWEPIN